MKGEALRRRQQQRHGVLGNQGGRFSGNVRYHNPAFPCHVQVDGIGSDPADGNHPQLGQFSKSRGVPFHVAAGIDDHVRLQGAADLLRFASGLF